MEVGFEAVLELVYEGMLRVLLSLFLTSFLIKIMTKISMCCYGQYRIFEGPLMRNARFWKSCFYKKTLLFYGFLLFFYQFQGRFLGDLCSGIAVFVTLFFTNFF